MTGDTLAAVRDAARLASLWRLALLDTPADEAFDRLTRLAATFLAAPVALVSLVDADRQFFKSCLGLREPWASRRETPLSHSFCQHTVAARAPLVVEDARTHPLVHDNPAIRDLGVVAYLGIPLVTTDGQALGSLCVFDSQPRRWTEEQVALLTDLADLVMEEIERHGATRAAEQERRALDGQLRERDALLDLVGSRLPIATFICDGAGVITRCSGTAVADLGLDPGDIVGRAVADLPRTLAGCAATLRDALAGEASTTRQDIGGRLVETTAVPLRDAEGGIAGAVGFTIDRSKSPPARGA